MVSSQVTASCPDCPYVVVQGFHPSRAGGLGYPGRYATAHLRPLTAVCAGRVEIPPTRCAILWQRVDPLAHSSAWARTHSRGYEEPKSPAPVLSPLRQSLCDRKAGWNAGSSAQVAIFRSTPPQFYQFDLPAREGADHGTIIIGSFCNKRSAYRMRYYHEGRYHERRCLSACRLRTRR